MNGENFAFTGFVVMLLLVHAAGIVYAVGAWRRWRPTGWMIPLAAVLLPITFLICPIVEHFVRPRMRARGVDRRIVSLKLALAWFAPVLTVAGYRIAFVFCKRAAMPDAADALALACTFGVLFLYELFLVWLSRRVDALAESPER